MGNTCFLNSVLQCLTYTPPLAAYLQSGLHKSSCRVPGFCGMCALEGHVKQALSTSGRIISPSYLVKNLRCIARSFQMWRQEDAHEYLRYLIEALQKCCRSVEGLGGSSVGSQKNLIHRIFGGRLRSQVKCSQCSYCSNTYDPFLDLSLEIVRAESLLRALARFTAVEVLDGGNKYHCSRCKTKVRALKQFTIDQLPHVLTIQFKRFSSSGLFGGKIDKKVHFDRTIDMKPFVSGGEGAQGGDLKYSLYAVLVHSGWSTHSGHYYCFVRTGMDMWHVLDDGRVSQVSEKTVLEQKAYILFYVRNEKQPPSGDSNGPLQNGDHIKAGLENSQQQRSSEDATSCDSAITQLSGGDNNGHLQNGEISGIDRNQLPQMTNTTEKKFPFPNLATPASRSTLSVTTVPCWGEENGCKGNDEEAGKSPDSTTAHCGYVLDEWDEEYDRGKRKKVRNKSVENENLLVASIEGAHPHKKMKKMGHSMAEQTSMEGNHDRAGDGNLFQAVAGSKLQVVSHRSKKFKTRCRALGYKMFLKRHLFRHF